MRATVALAALALCAACASRTVITPGATAAAPEQTWVGTGGCNVRDYASATELPAGSRNLGWVRVAQQDSDEATFLTLRQRICEMGGDALSQAAWVRDPGDEQPQLTANAWVLP